MTAHTIEINLDKPCVRCGKGGATQCGLCLECVSKRLVEKIRNERSISMPKIGEKTIGFIEESIDRKSVV